MTSFVVCCSMYERGRPFLDQWIAATVAACKDKSAEVVVASDSLADASRSLGRLADAVPVSLTHVPTGSTLAEVRIAMFRRALRTDKDVLVFIDMDDMLLASSLDLHARALSDADFSYGDLWLTDEAGIRTGELFFSGAGIPDAVSDYCSILTRNFLGLSNTAVWRNRLIPSACAVPSHLLAVDWWFYARLLMQGLHGRMTEGPVADYRTYGGNLVGGRPGIEVPAVLRRCVIVRDHYRALPQTPQVAKQLDRILALIRRLENAAPPIAEQVAKICSRRGVWWEDVGTLAQALAGGEEAATLTRDTFADE
jgi:hypothetical protein